MGNYELLKAAINDVIKANGRQEITGEVLNQVLLSMVNSFGAGYQCMGVATPSTNPGTPDQNVFYFATQAGTYTNFDAIVLQAGISVLIWDGDWASQTWFTIDATPTNNSQNLIASGAVFNALKLDGGAYDVTAHNSGATFASLSALLNSENLNTLIPSEIRHGGMSIKFVQSSDNKYVQFRYMSSSTAVVDFINVANWQGVDAEPTIGSKNLVESNGVNEFVRKKKELQNTFELGSIEGLNTNSWTYVNTDRIIRTKQNTYLKLKKGDRIICSDYTTIKMYIGCKDDYTKGTQGWIIHDFIAQYDGEYVIVAAYIAGGTVTVEGLGSKFTRTEFISDSAYYDVDNEPTPNSENLVKSGGVNEKISYHGYSDITTAEANNEDIITGSIADLETRKVSTVVATNRVLIGPFYFTHDTEITIDEGLQYNIFYLFPDDTTSYSQMYSGWQTGKHIIGVHPKYINQIMYYILMSKTDNSAMDSLPAYVYKNYIHLKNVDGENPLHFIFCDIWTSDATPKGNNSLNRPQYQRLWAEKNAERDMYCYFGNDTLVFSVYNNGQEILSNSTYPFILPQNGVTRFLIRKNVGHSSEFRDCTSFSQLYNIINFNAEFFDFKKLEGNNIFTDTIAITKGGYFKNGLSGGLVIQGENIGYSHTPSLKFYDGKAYVAMQTNTSGVETSSDTGIVLSEIDIVNNQVVANYVIAKSGTYGGVTFNGACSNSYSYILGSTLHIIYNAHASGVYLVHCAFNLETKEFTNEICTIEHNSETKTFNNANLKSLFGTEYGIKDYGFEFVASQIATDGTYYYIAISSGNFENGKTPIMYTSDFSTWKLFDVPDMEYGSNCEIAIYINGNYLYGASRHGYDDCTLCIWKMNMTTKKIEDSVQINDCATRPTFFVKFGIIYLAHGLCSRKCLQIIKISTSRLAQSTCYLECQDTYELGYNSFENIGDDTYIAIQRYVSGISTPRNVLAKLTVF